MEPIKKTISCDVEIREVTGGKEIAVTFGRKHEATYDEAHGMKVQARPRMAFTISNDNFVGALIHKAVEKEDELVLTEDERLLHSMQVMRNEELVQQVRVLQERNGNQADLITSLRRDNGNLRTKTAELADNLSTSDKACRTLVERCNVQQKLIEEGQTLIASLQSQSDRAMKVARDALALVKDTPPQVLPWAQHPANTGGRRAGKTAAQIKETERALYAGLDVGLFGSKAHAEAMTPTGWTLEPVDEAGLIHRPVPIAPELNSHWQHYNGKQYRVISIANEHCPPGHRHKYPVTVVYTNAKGKVFTRPLHDWHRSMTPLPAWTVLL